MSTIQELLERHSPLFGQGYRESNIWKCIENHGNPRFWSMYPNISPVVTTYTFTNCLYEFRSKVSTDIGAIYLFAGSNYNQFYPQEIAIGINQKDTPEMYALNVGNVGFEQHELYIEYRFILPDFSYLFDGKNNFRPEVSYSCDLRSEDVKDVPPNTRKIIRLVCTALDPLERALQR